MTRRLPPYAIVQTGISFAPMMLWWLAAAPGRHDVLIDAELRVRSDQAQPHLPAVLSVETTQFIYDRVPGGPPSRSVAHLTSAVLLANISTDVWQITVAAAEPTKWATELGGVVLEARRRQHEALIACAAGTSELGWRLIADGTPPVIAVEAAPLLET